MAVDYTKYLDGNSLKAIKNYIDNNFLKTTDISAWAKASSKPSYTHNEIGAGNLTIGDGSNTLFFRTNASWASAIYHNTTSDEAVVFLNKGINVGGAANYTTSWIFAYGTPSERPTWTGLTPVMQIKGTSVVINKLLGSKVGSSYNLDVNGTLNATTIYQNGTTLANTYLGKTAKAADSSKLNGQSASYYQVADNLLSQIVTAWDRAHNGKFGLLQGYTEDGGVAWTNTPLVMGELEDQPGLTYQLNSYSDYNWQVKTNIIVNSPNYAIVQFRGNKQDDSSTSIYAGISFYNWILTADTTDTEASFRTFKLPNKSAGTYTLATTSDINSLMTPSFVNYTSITSRSLPSQYVGGSGGYYLSPGTRNSARFYVGTVGANSNGIYVFTYAGIMLMFVCYGMTANIYYMSYGAIYDGSYGGGRYYYYIDSSGYLTIFSTSNALPSGYTAYLHKLKLY